MARTSVTQKVDLNRQRLDLADTRGFTAPGAGAARRAAMAKLSRSWILEVWSAATDGAHLDGVGIGQEVNGDRINNGAYDNATGSAILLEVARALGASDTVCAPASLLAQAVREHIGGGADVVIEAAGHPLAQVAAAEVLARGGRLTILGIAGSDRTTPFNFDPLVFRDARLEAVFAYPSAVFARAVRLIDEGGVDPTPLITHRFGLSEANRALALLEARGEPAIKVLLDPRA